MAKAKSAAVSGREQGVELVRRAAFDSGDVETIPVRYLRPADSPRSAGEDARHIRLLAECGAVLPPILVQRESMRVIDGMHRLRAAVMRGQDTIRVRFFDGDDDAAFLAGVRGNLRHGLPLSLADRKAAAGRLVSSYPHWSDRAIAAAAGLAASTVGAVRDQATASRPAASARVGRDGRVRPIDSAAGRRIAGELIHRNPRASLREIAKAAGISPMTARDVRQRVVRGDDPVPAGRRAVPDAAGTNRSRPTEGCAARSADRWPVRDRETVLRNLRDDPSVRLSEQGRILLRWLIARSVRRAEWATFVDAVPIHCASAVADLARACAEEWRGLAERLEQRMDHTG
jgi:ParB-like chromosome segregation protein Spo0J